MPPNSVYIAGGMRNKPLYGFQDFEDVTCALTKQGLSVVSPHQLDIDHVRCFASWHYDPNGRRVFTAVDLPNNFDIESTLCADFIALLGVEGIVMLPGWDLSDGACKERTVAEWAGKKIGFWEPSKCNVRWTE